MGSLVDFEPPLASSSSIVLTRPTAVERRRTWALSHELWGGAISLDDYLAREEYLTTVPLARNGGIEHWILTVDGSRPDERPILSSCETLRKRALVIVPSRRTTTATNGFFRNPAPESKHQEKRNSNAGDNNTSADDGTVEELGSQAMAEEAVVDALSYGIGSVFTDPQYRGNGYASRMLELVRDHLKHDGGPRRSAEIVDSRHDSSLSGTIPPSKVAFSVLFSDIGKTFYAKLGWRSFPSRHVSFLPKRGGGGGGGNSKTKAVVSPVHYHHLAELCATDETLLRKTLAHKRDSENNKRPCVAFLPDLDAILWHMMREDFVTSAVFGKTPDVRGAVVGEKGRRVWALWTRSYLSEPSRGESNTFHILRTVVEEKCDPAHLDDSLSAIIDSARREAFEWQSQQVELWNPDVVIIESLRRTGIEFKLVDRQTDSIPCLCWNGEQQADDIEWIANEKYAWF